MKKKNYFETIKEIVNMEQLNLKNTKNKTYISNFKHIDFCKVCRSTLQLNWITSTIVLLWPNITGNACLGKLTV